VRWLVALIVWAGAAAGAWEIQAAVARSIGSGNTAGSSSFDPTTVKAADSDSLFRAVNLRKALASVRSHVGNAKVTTAALYPGYLSLTLVKGDQEDVVAYYVGGNYVDDGASGDASADQAFPLATLTADGPATLAQRIAGGAHVALAQLHYLVLSVDPISNRIDWDVYPLDTNRIEYFEANSPTGPITEQTASGSASLSGATGTPGAGTFDASTLQATDPLSLFRTANFAKALATVRTRLGAGVEVSEAAVYPGYLALTAVKSGQEDDVEIDAQGNYESTSMGSAAGQAGFPLSELAVNGPATLAQRIARYGATPETHLHYMVIDIDPTSNKVEWLVYTLKGSRVEYFHASSPTSLIHGYIAGG
jgi:hypothetical protein